MGTRGRAEAARAASCILPNLNTRGAQPALREAEEEAGNEQCTRSRSGESPLHLLPSSGVALEAVSDLPHVHEPEQSPGAAHRAEAWGQLFNFSQLPGNSELRKDKDHSGTSRSYFLSSCFVWISQEFRDILSAPKPGFVCVWKVRVQGKRRATQLLRLLFKGRIWSGNTAACLGEVFSSSSLPSDPLAPHRPPHMQPSPRCFSNACSNSGHTTQKNTILSHSTSSPHFWDSGNICCYLWFGL